ncbi:MAG: enoyl-[acyl-carrier-protein] reductase FabK [Anaerovoracaceae bacterium]|nr:enoyl-[acyl-carrier-protein] reductase FabK [Bacillota bacterium]MDY2671301.1 enoyl-[acyl-carrier-protein] reductase FabK [Anaerovoracaceae bacterium]
MSDKVPQIKTEITEMLGIEYPIFQGGMAWIADASLGGAVSQAGGLGIISCGILTVDKIREEVRKIKELTDKPFGLNVMLESHYVDDIMQMIIDEKVPVITTGAGNPGKYIPTLKEQGIKVIPVAGSVPIAQRVARAGADAVIAEGMESGGHIGEATTMALVPQVIDAIDIPVIAAGGIADGRGMAAAFMLGAQGVQLGTRFLSATECTVSEAYKKAIIKAKATGTTVTGNSTGHPIRVLRNKLSRKIQMLEKHGGDPEEVVKLGVGALRRAAEEGDVDNGAVMSGQIAGLVKEEQPAAEIIADLMNGCIDVFDNRNAIVKGRQ